MAPGQREGRAASRSSRRRRRGDRASRRPPEAEEEGEVCSWRLPSLAGEKERDSHKTQSYSRISSGIHNTWRIRSENTKRRQKAN